MMTNILVIFNTSEIQRDSY